MIAISTAESGLNPKAHNPRYPDDSYGLFQINMLDEPGYKLGEERRQRYGLRSNEELKNPTVNAKAALDIRNRQGLGAWSVYTSGAYKQYLPEAQEAAKRALAGGAAPLPTATPPTAPPSVQETETKTEVKEKTEPKAFDFLKMFRSLRPALGGSKVDVQDALTKAMSPPQFFE